MFRFIYDRRPVKIVVRETGGGVAADSYGGIAEVFVLEGELLVPSSTSPEQSTVFVFMVSHCRHHTHTPLHLCAS